MLILLLGDAICYALSNFISNSATAALLMPPDDLFHFVFQPQQVGDMSVSDY